MNDKTNLRGKYFEIEISGGSNQKGELVDYGLDILVLHNQAGNSFIYIPTIHIQKMKQGKKEEEVQIQEKGDNPLEMDAISFRKILMAAKGMFIQINVTGKKTIHGYLTSIMNDYFVFHSPVFKTMYISMNHVKWLIPYPPNATPYSLSQEQISLLPYTSPLSRSFEEQIKKHENQLVILDGGTDTDKIGLIDQVHDRVITLINAERETIYLNIEHIKSIQFP